MVDKVLKPGTIDLTALFEALADQLSLAVKQGRLLHKTKNIRDAGAPFETAFRNFLGSRLPSPFSIAPGYLFDPSAICTPQIDAIVIDGQESHELMRSEEGAAYVPFPAGRVLVEIKNGAKNIEKHVHQIRAIGGAFETMRDETGKSRSGGPFMFRPLTMLVIGDSSDAKLETFKDLYKGETDPDFTFLLDRGLIIARLAPLDEFAELSPAGRNSVRLDFIQRSTARWAIWEPLETERKRGRTLLWLYYAIVANLNQTSRGNMGQIRHFTDQVSRDFPLHLKSVLADATDW